jgi:peptidoglycan/xylan/chitin deacetylase (PgdA/CDA1 family)
MAPARARVVTERRVVRRVVRRGLRSARIRAAALRAAATAGRGLILVYHRVTHGREPDAGIIPEVPAHVFRRQIRALLEIGEVVTLEELLRERRNRRRPRLAITFDDDYLSHHDVVLPALRDLGVTATFFLCGRSLYGMGPTWFEVLDRLFRREGLEGACRLIGARARSIEELAVACEGSEAMRDAVMSQRDAADWASDRLQGTHIAALAEAGMAVGFHTLRHLVLPALDDEPLRRELVEGRDALAAVSSQPISLFAYPHGKADVRTARAIRDAGYRAAVTGRPGPTSRRSNPLLLRRWEPGPLGTDAFLAGIAAKLIRPDFTARGRGGHPRPGPA